MELPSGVASGSDGVIDIKQSGRLAVATTNAFDGVLPRACEAAGVRVQAVEATALEEIFVRTCSSSREEITYESPSHRPPDSQGLVLSRIADLIAAAGTLSIGLCCGGKTPAPSG